MSKHMLISNGTVFVSDKGGIKSGVPFTNNIVDRIILEDIVEYLDNQINEEHKNLVDKENERKYRLTEYKMNTLIATGVSVVSPVAIGLLGGMHKTQMDTIFGQTNALLAFSAMMIPCLIVFSQILVGYGLSFRPSKSLIKGYGDRLNYQIEVLDELKVKLAGLKSDNANDKIDQFEQNIPIEIDLDSRLKYYKDSAKLRFVYGSQNKKVMKLYNQGTLADHLREYGMDEMAIVDFIMFIDNELAREKEDARLHGRVYKG